MIHTVLCADIGTSSLKTALIDRDGIVYAFARVPFETVEFRSHNPSVWMNSFAAAVKELLAQIEQNTKISICALCVSGNGPTIAADDYILLWNESLRANSDCSFAPDFAPSLFLPRLAYIKKCLPAVWNAHERFFSGPEYVIHQLCGAVLTILPESRFESAYWTDEQLKKAGVEKQKLPPFVPAGFCAGVLSETAAAFLGLAQSSFAENHMRIICGAPDFIVALIGTETLETGSICDRAGSSEGINMCLDFPVSVDGIRTLPSVIPALYNASVLLARQNPHDTTSVVAEVQKAVAMLEKASGIRVKKMRVTGGQARNATLNQLKSRVLRIPIEVTALFDAELMGDAVLAFCTLGEYATIQEAAKKMVKVSHVF